MAVHHAVLDGGVGDLRSDIRIALVVADFNSEITHQICALNLAYLEEQGFTFVDVYHVPGAFELPGMSKELLDKGVYNLIIVLGCVIKGQTPHFDYICAECSRGMMQLSMNYDTPLIFGVLTCLTLEQAKARIDTNYAIYGLNYLISWTRAHEQLDMRYEELLEIGKGKGNCGAGIGK